MTKSLLAFLGILLPVAAAASPLEMARTAAEVLGVQEKAIQESQVPATPSAKADSSVELSIDDADSFKSLIDKLRANKQDDGLLDATAVALGFSADLKTKGTIWHNPVSTDSIKIRVIDVMNKTENDGLPEGVTRITLGQGGIVDDQIKLYTCLIEIPSLGDKNDAKKTLHAALKKIALTIKKDDKLQSGEVSKSESDDIPRNVATEYDRKTNKSKVELCQDNLAFWSTWMKNSQPPAQNSAASH